MKGLELSEKFYKDQGKPLLETDFSHIIHMVAVGLTGSGSECFGFDDDISKDHDFEPGFCIFIPDALDRDIEFKLERAYSKLPKEFEGYRRSNITPVGGKRHGVIRIGDFFEAKVGRRDGRLDPVDWLSIPEYVLAEAVNGKIFMDNYGQLTAIREYLSNMPNDIKLKKLAGNLLVMGQSGQYNYARCIKRGETGAAQLSVFRFAESAMKVIFLLNEMYMPYYKWSFKALRNLPELSRLGTEIEDIISLDNSKEHVKEKNEKISTICQEIIKVLNAEGITKYDGNEMEGHAYSVNNLIKDGVIRNYHILSAI